MTISNTDYIPKIPKNFRVSDDGDIYCKDVSLEDIEAAIPQIVKEYGSNMKLSITFEVNLEGFVFGILEGSGFKKQKRTFKTSCPALCTDIEHNIWVRRRNLKT